MIPYYEELNDEEKNAVTKVIRTLLKQTFVLERKYAVSYTHLDVYKRQHILQKKN